MKTVLKSVWNFIKSIFGKKSSDQTSTVSINNKVKTNNGPVSIDQSNMKINNRNNKENTSEH